jgi:anti-sigma B factor antagonist/stage II sporulation protein AA (anti-sigma F factor antagonist)
MGSPPSPDDSPAALPAVRRGAALVVSPRGRVDHATADAFRAALEPHLDACRPGHPLVLDLGAVDYVASVGLRVLMLAARQAKAQGGTIAIANLSPLVREIFEISKFTLVFRCFPTVEEALAAVAGPPGGGGP